MKIFKSFTIILGIIFLFIVLLSVATFIIVKHIKIKELVEHEIEQQLGINVTIEKIGYSPLLTHIFAQGITIHNPPGFNGKELAYIKAIHFVWDPGDMIILKKPTIYVCGVNLERLNIIKNALGKVNIEELVPIKDQKSISQDGTPFFFDILVLSIGDVRYTDYTASSVKTHIYHINIKNKSFVLLQNEDEVIKLIVYNAIQNTDIGRLINLTIAPITSNVSDTIDAAWGTAKAGARSAMEIASMPFKLIFGR